MASGNEHASSSLRVPIVGRVDDTPLNGIAKIRKGRKDQCEVAAALASRGLQQSIHVLQKNVAGPVGLKDSMNLPPQDALLALDAMCLIERLRYGVVLTRKATNQEIMSRNLLGGHASNVAVTGGRLVWGDAEVSYVAFPCVLRGGTRLPLVRPDHFPGSTLAIVPGGRVKGGSVGLGYTLKTQPETSDAGKKLNDTTDSLRWRSISSGSPLRHILVPLRVFHGSRRSRGGEDSGDSQGLLILASRNSSIKTLSNTSSWV